MGWNDAAGRDGDAVGGRSADPCEGRRWVSKSSFGIWARRSRPAGPGELSPRLEMSSWLCGRESAIQHDAACSFLIRFRTVLTECQNVRAIFR